MTIIKSVSAKSILDSRKEKTILVSIKTNFGSFSASAPNGKSKGKYETKPYKKNLEGDIKTIKEFKDYFSEEVIENFADLKRVEDIVHGHIGANTLFALESCVLKSLASEQKKQVWELINPKANKLPRLIGNCVGGGAHTAIHGNSKKEFPRSSVSTQSAERKHSEIVNIKKPDFQEFLLIPKGASIIQSFNVNKKAKEKTQAILQDVDENFKNKENDENAWISSLDDKKVLEVLKRINIPLGIDVAASSFYKRKKYSYENPMLHRTEDEQLEYLSNLIKNFHLLYIEDGFGEENFESFAKLLKKFPDRLIVGDDLTVTNYKRFEKAIKMKSINSIIIKPNQCGSLLEVASICKFAKENNIKIVFSHRSGETKETILADLAFGFQANFFKCGIEGDVREGKIKRLIEIEKSL